MENPKKTKTKIPDKIILFTKFSFKKSFKKKYKKNPNETKKQK